MSILDLLADLRKADDRLQACLLDLKKRYYAFIYAPLRTNLKFNRLLLRSDHDREGRIRRLFWSRKTNAVRRLRTGRRVRLSDRLRGPFKASWVYTIAHDWSHRKAYYAFEDRRRVLTALRREVVRAIRAVRLSFSLRWGPQASPADWAEARLLLQSKPSKTSAQDLRAVAGALVFCRRLRELETKIGLLVEEYRRLFRHRSQVLFEPELRTRPNGTLRLAWVRPEVVHTQDGPRLFTHHIPGRPTDLWMRLIRLPLAARKEVAAYLKRLLPLQRRYSSLARILAAHRRRCRAIIARVEHLVSVPWAGPAPDPGGCPQATWGRPIFGESKSGDPSSVPRRPLSGSGDGRTTI